MLILTSLGRRLFYAAALSAAALVLTTTAAFAQEKQYTEGKSDLALRSEARVDPATLGMSLEIPLGGAPGRAGNSLPDRALFLKAMAYEIHWLDGRGLRCQDVDEAEILGKCLGRLDEQPRTAAYRIYG